MAWLEFQGASSGGILRRQLFTANGTWTKPEGLIGEQVWVTAIGGGGSGGLSGNPIVGSYGGEYVTREPIDVSLTSSVSVSVGTVTADSAGGPSSFGAFISVSGGTNHRTTATGNMCAPGLVRSSGDFAIGQSTGGPFGASGGTSLALVNNEKGPSGAGLVLDNSGTTAEQRDVTGEPYRAIGYGAGGCANSLGAPGAVMVEWLEKV